MANIEMSGTGGCIEDCRGCDNARKIPRESDLSAVVEVAKTIRKAFPKESFDVMVHDTPAATGVDIYGHEFFQNLGTLQVGLSSTDIPSPEMTENLHRIIDKTRVQSFVVMSRIGAQSPDEILAVARKWLEKLSVIMPTGSVGSVFTNNTFRLPPNTTLADLERAIYSGLAGFWGNESIVGIETTSLRTDKQMVARSTQYREGNTQSVAIRYMLNKIGIAEAPQKSSEEGNIFITPAGVHFEHDVNFMGKTFLPTQEALALLKPRLLQSVIHGNSFSHFVQRGLDMVVISKGK